MNFQKYGLVILLLVLAACSGTELSQNQIPETPTSIPTPLPPSPTPKPVNLNIDFTEAALIFEQSEEKEIVIEQTDFSEEIHMMAPGTKFEHIFDGEMEHAIISVDFDSTVSEFGFESGDFVGLYCRYHDPMNFIGAGYYDMPEDDASTGYIIFEMIEGELEALSFAPFPSGDSINAVSGQKGSSDSLAVGDEEHRIITLGLDCIEDTITLHQNDTVIIRAYTADISAGKAGLSFWRGIIGAETERIWSVRSISVSESEPAVVDEVIQALDFSSPEHSRFCMDITHEEFDPESIVVECKDEQLWFYTGDHKSGGSIPRITGSPFLKDVSIEMDVTYYVRDSIYGVLCRNSSEGGYLFGFTGQEVQFLKLEYAESSLNFEAPFTWDYHYSSHLDSLEFGKPYHLRVDCVGSRMTAYVNDIVVIDVWDDTPLGIGGIGFGLHEYEQTDTLVSVDNFQIKALRPESAEVMQSQLWAYAPFDNLTEANFGSDKETYAIHKDYRNNVVVFENKTISNQRWWYLGPLLTDQVVSVTAQTGEDNPLGYGVICRETDAGHYAALIVSNTFYTFHKYDTESGDYTYFTSNKRENSFSSAIEADDENDIVLSCIGSSIRLFINGELVAEVEDDTFSVGVPGIIIEGNGKPDEITFSDMQVTLIE